jgi:transposase
LAICPPRRGNRKGSVEKSVHYATQRFWRTMTAATMDRAATQLLSDTLVEDGGLF